MAVSVSLQLLVGWLFADFITGIVHWVEDRYMHDSHSLEFARGVATDNILHHDQPTAMLKNTMWENMRSAAIFAWPAALLSAWIGGPLWLTAGLFFSSFGNLIHRFAHTPKRDLPRWIRALQEMGLFLSAKHHATHHFAMGVKVSKPEANRAYCPMSDLVNPVLDYFRFWSRCEAALAKVGINTLPLEPAS